jgi:hypothetical protein
MILPSKLKLDSFLSHNTLFEGMLDNPHFRDHVSDFDNLGLGIAPGQDDVEHGGFFLQDVHYLFHGQEAVANGIVDFVQNDQIVLSG